MNRWTSPADIRAAVQREWDSGRLLRARLAAMAVAEDPAGQPNLRPQGQAEPPGGSGGGLDPSGTATATGGAAGCPASEAEPSALLAVLDHRGRTPVPFRVKLRRPTSRDLAQDFDGVREWAERIGSVPNGVVERSDVTSRLLGSQSLPAAVVFPNHAPMLALIGESRAATRFEALAAGTPARFLPAVAARPLRVLEAAGDWPAIVAAAEWILAHHDPGIYLRQAGIPGAHTKIIERHSRLIAAFVDSVHPAAATQPPTAGKQWFERRYGFRTRPALVRFRQLDPRRAALPGLTDVTLTVAEFAQLRPPVHTVFVTENEINFLSFPAAAGSLVIFGSGNEAPEMLGGIPWLADTAVHYWGDIDTHGFTILDRVRRQLPHTTSMLMDRDTLLTHRDSWGREPHQSRRDLASLTDEEASLYSTLLANTLGDQIRLEQELVGYGRVLRAVAAACRGRAG